MGWRRKESASREDLLKAMEGTYATLCEGGDFSSVSADGTDESIKIDGTPESYQRAINFVKEHKAPWRLRLHKRFGI